MNRYRVLADAAAARSLAFFEHRACCARVANIFAHGLQTYLDAPMDRLWFVQLNDDLRSTGTRHSIDSDPTLTLGRDAYWYCGIRVHFESGAARGFLDVITKVGFSRRSDGFHVKVERDCLVDPQNVKTMEPAFAEWERDVLEYCNTPPGEVGRAIGFLADA